MIEFKGEISDEIRLRIMKKQDRLLGYMILPITLIAGVCALILFLTNDGSYKEFLFYAILLVFITAFLFIAPQFKNLSRFKSFKWVFVVKISEVNIEEKSLILDRITFVPIEKVKKVIDEGDCYIIRHIGSTTSIICQKSLLVEGTIEEFEELFKDKLVRKIKDKNVSPEQTKNTNI